MLTYHELRAARRGADRVKVYIACPVCGPGRSRSGQRKKPMVTRDKGEGLIGYHCYHCGIDGFAREDGGTRQQWRSDPKRTTENKRNAAAQSKKESEYVQGIWDEAAPIAGTPGEQWLAGRGITISSVPDYGGLRFHPNCPANYEGARRRPCVVARYTDALTGEPKGIRHRTIEPGPYTAMTLGPMHGCVIRLWPEQRDNFLCISEGVETALYAATKCAVQGRLLQPMWATGSAGNMQTLPVLPNIQTLAFVADNDDSNAGEKAAKDCAERWAAAGRDALVLTPKTCCDFNDFFTSEIGDAA